MSHPSLNPRENRLLREMAAADFALIEPHLVSVELDRSTVLIEPDTPIEHAYFLTSGLSSIIALSSEIQSIEIGLSGREGLIGTPLVLDSDRTPHRVFMQVGGAGFRIDAAALGQVMDERLSIRKLLSRYVQTFAIQTAYTALSNGVHTIEERLARWLLMSHDRQDHDEIPLTHDFMALMLGVRRPSVTIALHSLEGLGFIKATRGQVAIRDRAALKDFAGTAYGTPEAEYQRLIGPLR